MIKAFCHRFLAPLLILAVIWSLGCARAPYRYGPITETSETLRLQPGEEQFERGRPHAFLDGLGHYLLSLPSKLLLFNWSVDNHNISPETEEALRQYLADNNLTNVKVRLNQYVPGAEWRRLGKNSEVGGFWRFTLGALTVIYYTILPGRAFGGDHYNPYTNTINIYSDHKAIVLHEGGHAKDFARRHFKGWYSALRLLPLVPLYQEGVASTDALSYDLDKQQPKDLKAAYKILYPAYCTYIGGEGLRWVNVSWWMEYAIRFSVAIPGHIVGRIKAAKVDETPTPREGKSVAWREK